MTPAEGFVIELQGCQKRFNTTISIFEESDASFAPNPGLYTVAGHIAHTADSVDWFVEGAFGKGWDMDFEAMIARAKAATNLAESVAWLDRAFANAIDVVGHLSEAELFAPITDKRIMEGAPRSSVISGITDHTAHHRGSLAVYARLIGKEAPMPYA
ncbi:MAG: DinB family protein [Longimicrobiales bacterium]